MLSSLPLPKYLAHPILKLLYYFNITMAGDSAHADPAFLAKLALRQQMNYDAMTFFAGAMGAFYLTMCIFVLLRRLCVDLGASRRPTIITAILR